MKLRDCCRYADQFYGRDARDGDRQYRVVRDARFSSRRERYTEPCHFFPCGLPGFHERRNYVTSAGVRVIPPSMGRDGGGAIPVHHRTHRFRRRQSIERHAKGSAMAGYQRRRRKSSDPARVGVDRRESRHGLGRAECRSSVIARQV